MASFEPFWARLLEHEGREYTNDPNDAGGPTKFGINIYTLRRHRHKAVTAKDVEDLTEEEAHDIAKNEWWPYDEIDSQSVANRAADFGFNTSIFSINGVKLLQNAANHLGRRLVVDGLLGPKTIEAVNTLPPERLIPEMKKAQRNHYWELIEKVANRGLEEWGWTHEETDMVTSSAKLQNLSMALDAKKLLLSRGKRIGNLSFIKGWLNRVEDEI